MPLVGLSKAGAKRYPIGSMTLIVDGTVFDPIAGAQGLLQVAAKTRS